MRRVVLVLWCVATLACGTSSTVARTPVPTSPSVTVTVPVVTTFATQCPVTVPQNPPFVPPAPYAPLPSDAGAIYYGTAAFWTSLPADGVWNDLPRNQVGYGQKIFWWRPGYDGRELRPALIVTGRRLNGETLTFQAQTATNAHFDGTWQMLVGVDFPTLGCWEMTGQYRENTLTFVVFVGSTS